MIFNFQVDLIERECSELMLEAGYQFKNQKRPQQENESEEKEGEKEKETDNEREIKEKEVTDGYGPDGG